MSTRSRAGARYCLFETALGLCGVAFSACGLTRVGLPDSDPSRTERWLARGGAQLDADPRSAIARAIAELQRYCTGAPVDFAAVALDMTGSGAFDCRVYEATRAIGFGRTTSYGELARSIGAPREARAVGQALGRNPIPIIVPCHRVLAKDGMGGFSAPGGTTTKERLLTLEGVRLETQMPLAFMRH